MPEQDLKERLISGGITETSSSDSSIRADIDQLRSEIHSVSTHVLDSEILSPQPVVSISNTENNETDPRYSIRNLNVGTNDSVLGLEILNRRKSRKKI